METEACSRIGPASKFLTLAGSDVHEVVASEIPVRQFRTTRKGT